MLFGVCKVCLWFLLISLIVFVRWFVGLFWILLFIMMLRLLRGLRRIICLR